MGYISLREQKAASLKHNLCGLVWELILSDEQESKVEWGGGRGNGPNTSLSSESVIGTLHVSRSCSGSSSSFISPF